MSRRGANEGAKINSLESRGIRDIVCNPRRLGRREHLALLPAAPSWIHIVDRQNAAETALEQALKQYYNKAISAVSEVRLSRRRRMNFIRRFSIVLTKTLSVSPATTKSTVIGRTTCQNCSVNRAVSSDCVFRDYSKSVGLCDRYTCTKC